MRRTPSDGIIDVAANPSEKKAGCQGEGSCCIVRGREQGTGPPLLGGTGPGGSTDVRRVDGSRLCRAQPVARTEGERCYHGGREAGLTIRPVIERLRGLSPPLRYLLYVAGALLVFLVATGVGAAAAIVVGAYPEWAKSGPHAPAGSGTTGGAAVETTGEADNVSSVKTTSEPTGE